MGHTHSTAVIEGEDETLAIKQIPASESLQGDNYNSFDEKT